MLEESVLIRGDGPGEPIPVGARLVVSPLDTPVEAWRSADPATIPSSAPRPLARGQLGLDIPLHTGSMP